MEVSCRRCRDDWAHCHGTVIIHALSRVECTEADCEGVDLITHDLRIDCDAVGCACGQATALAV
jgi:hypothetical protein